MFYNFLVIFMSWRYVLYTLGWLFCFLSLVCIRLHQSYLVFKVMFSACVSVTIYHGIVEVFWVSFVLR